MPSKSERPSFSRSKAAGREKIEAFIAAAPSAAPDKAAGRQPPEGTVRINANIPRSLYKRLKIKAAEEERSMTDVLTGLISRYVDQ